MAGFGILGDLNQRPDAFGNVGGNVNTTTNTGTNTGSTSGTTAGTTTYGQLSPLGNPDFAQLFKRAQKFTPTSLPGIEDIVSQGMNSPLLQLVLGPALQRLQAPQAAQRQQLTEATRAAGGLRGSTYGQDFNRLLQNQSLQTNDLTAQVIQQMLSPLISGQLQAQQNSMLPGRALTDLLRVITPQNVATGTTGTTTGTSTGSTTGTGTSPRAPQLTGWENIPPSLGLGTPMSGGVSPVSNIENMLRDLMNRGGGASVGVNAGGRIGGSEPAPYTPYLDPLSGIMGGGSYNLGMGGGTEWLTPPSLNLPSMSTPSPLEYGDWTPETVTEGWW